MSKFLRDPLFHFLTLGGLLFFLSSLWGINSTVEVGSNSNKITITQANQKHLAELFKITWQRAPTQDELERLIEEHIKEEIYYREAVALNLDKNDTIVRRRMRQKLEFMLDDISSLETPTTAELKEYFATNQEKYRTDHIFSFKQVLISSKQLLPDSPVFSSAQQQLNAGIAPEKLSRSALLPLMMNLETDRTIKNTFGTDFLTQILKLKKNSWQGPVISTFGTHLVFISLDQPSEPQNFDMAVQNITADYFQSKKENASEDNYKNLKKKYSVVVEGSL